ncbi:MAG: 4Fe-4S dicluster domain-containing protein [Deltaproteobacteria bacterium]|nr:4Fe-4S dicluster domain-containing protein [Deltaproteobacteria bacterium]
MEHTIPEIIIGESHFLDEVEQGSGIKVSACFQCRKCTNGCPVTFAMDIYPDQVMRYIQLGLKKEIRESATIWVCASCETCTTRCPNEIDIAGVMDFLKQSVVGEKAKAAESKVLAFHQAFLDDIRKRGRIFEAGLMQSYMLKSGAWLQKMKDLTIMDEMRLGWTMYRKGRLNLLPKKIKGKEEVQKMFKNKL